MNSAIVTVNSTSAARVLDVAAHIKRVEGLDRDVTTDDIKTFLANAERDEAARREEYERLAEQQKRLDGAAQATPCDYSDCDRTQHFFSVRSGDAQPGSWSHRVMNDDFHDGALNADVVIREGRATGSLYGEVESDMSANDFRRMADAFESYPAWLRAFARRIDEANGESL